VLAIGIALAAAGPAQAQWRGRGAMGNFNDGRGYVGSQLGGYMGNPYFGGGYPMYGNSAYNGGYPQGYYPGQGYAQGYYPGQNYYSGQGYYPNAGYSTYPQTSGVVTDRGMMQAGGVMPSGGVVQGGMMQGGVVQGGYTGPLNPGMTQAMYTPSGGSPNTAMIRVIVPTPDAKVFFEDQPTRQTGTVRDFVSPPLEQGRSFQYTVKVQTQQGDHPADLTKTVDVRAGGQAVVDFSREQLNTPAGTPATGTETHGTPTPGTTGTPGTTPGTTNPNPGTNPNPSGTGNPGTRPPDQR